MYIHNISYIHTYNLLDYLIYLYLLLLLLLHFPSLPGERVRKHERSLLRCYFIDNMEWRSVASLLLSLGMVIMLFPRPLHSTDDGPFSQYLDGGELVDQDITLEQLQQEDDTHPIYSDSMETEDGDDEHDEEEEEEKEEGK